MKDYFRKVIVFGIILFFLSTFVQGVFSNTIPLNENPVDANNNKQEENNYDYIFGTIYAGFEDNALVYINNAIPDGSSFPENKLWVCTLQIHYSGLPFKYDGVIRAIPNIGDFHFFDHKYEWIDVEYIGPEGRPDDVHALDIKLIPRGNYLYCLHACVSINVYWNNNGYWEFLKTITDEIKIEGEIRIFRSRGVVQGTQITMAPGSPVTTKSIETLQAGELISSYDPISQEVTTAEIYAVCEYTENPPNALIFNDILEVIPKQTIFIDSTGWMEASDVGLYDVMLGNIPGTSTIYPVPIITKEQTILENTTTYDLVIRPITDEAVGYWADGILVGGLD